VPTLWHASLFLESSGLGFFSSFCLVASTAFSYKKFLIFPLILIYSIVSCTFYSSLYLPVS
jgi:hypothetical protein